MTIEAVCEKCGDKAFIGSDWKLNCISCMKNDGPELLPSLPVDFKFTKKTIYEAKMVREGGVEMSLREEDMNYLESRINAWLKDNYILKSVTKIEIPVAHLG